MNKDEFYPGMSNTNNLKQQLQQMEQLAAGSKLQRLLHHPAQYCKAIFFREIIYRITKKPWLQQATLFFGEPFFVRLPAATDIFLTGGKSDDTEIRLAKFLLENLKPGDCFADVGAHFGYYARLASECVKEQGKVYAFEGSKKNFELLQRNTQAKKNIECLNMIVSDKNGTASIYEFEENFSEYNSLYPNQYQKQSWYAGAKQNAVQQTSVTLNQFFLEKNLFPTIIKIDVEGAEYDVLNGAAALLEKNVTIIMEYLAASRNNENHKKAKELLTQAGYHSIIIEKMDH